MRTYSTIIMASAFLLIASGAWAAIVPISQSRSVSSYADAESGSEFENDNSFDTAEDFGPFIGSASSSAEVEGATASGSGYQTSSIDPSVISINGGCAAYGEGWDFEGYGSGSGSTSFSCEFTITEATQFTLTGYIDAYDDGESLLVLTGPNTVIDRWAYNSEELLDESGELQPGTYQLQVEANSSAYGDYSTYGYAYGGFDLTFLIESVSSAFQSGPDLSLAAGPNPFAGNIQIYYSTAQQKSATLEVFDLRGRRLKSFTTSPSESSVLNWDGSDDSGRSLAPGMYFLVLRSGGQERREKIMLVK